MAKPSNKKRKAAQHTAQPVKKQHADPVPQEEEELIGGLIFGDELQSTVDVIQTVAQNPSLLKSKTMKPFKSAMYDCWRSMQEVSGTGSSLTSRISTTLQSSLHLESLVLLAELRLRGQTPKLGSLQRWVRECDAAAIATASSTKKRSQAEEEQEDRLVWEVLDALLRSCTTLASDAVEEVKDGEVEAEVKRGGKGVRRWKAWDVRKLLDEKDRERSTGRNYTKAVEEDTMVGEFLCIFTNMGTLLMGSESFFLLSSSSRASSFVQSFCRSFGHHPRPFSSTSQPFPCHRLPRYPILSPNPCVGAQTLPYAQKIRRSRCSWCIDHHRFA